MEFNVRLGMFGVLVITDATTPVVDREFVLFLHDYYPEEVPSLGMEMNSFNGGSFLGNTPNFTAKVGDRVRWRIATIGREFHVFHLHGHRWISETGKYTDSELLASTTTLTIEYTEDNPGQWLYHCHVDDHFAHGMTGWYLVNP